jgi:hypothetical protein
MIKSRKQSSLVIARSLKMSIKYLLVKDNLDGEK